MGDSTACYHFGMIFARMAKEPERYRELAHFIYGVCREIDFHPCELELDDALIAWGLAKEGPNPDEPEEAVLYLGVDYGEYPRIYEDVVTDPEDVDTEEFE
jgi:hypothetical protein